jgi:hypothetical protein
MIAACPRSFTERKLVRIAAKVGIERQRNEMLGDVFRLDLNSGVPPGAIRRAGPSRSRERAAVGRRENHERLILGDRLAPRFGNVREPRNLSPRAFAFLRLDNRV